VAMDVNDERKGFKFFVEAIQLLHDDPTINSEDWELVILGRSNESLTEQLPFKYHLLGFLSDQQKIAEAYAMADVFVMPTLEDNLPNTILESLSCGLPVVGFAVGGVPQMIQHKKNGYLAKPKNSKDLAVGLEFILSDEQLLETLSTQSRKDACEQFSFEVVAKKYLDFYKKLI